MKKSFKRLSWVLMLVMVFSLVLPFNTAFADESSTTTITVLGTSDLHGMLANWEYSSDTEQAAAGMTKIQTLVKAEKAKSSNVILVDNGDAVQGNMMSAYNNSPVHPMVEAMNYMGYDAWIPGNHEFNYGLDFLNKNIAAFKGKVLAANLYNEDGTRKVDPYVIIEKSGVRVAIVGLTNPNIPTWEASTPDHTKGLKFTDPVVEAQKVVKELEGKYDVLIGSFHMGETAEYTKSDSVSAVADACPQFNAIIVGHAHSKFDNHTSNSGVKMIEPGNNGALLAKIDVTVEKAGGKWVVKNVATANLDTAKVTPDKDMAAKFADIHNALRKEANVVIGQSTARYIDRLDYLTGYDKVTTMPTSQVQDNAIVDLVNTVQMYYTGADISSAAIFTATSQLPAGDVKKKDMANIYMYDNTLVGVNITGKNLKAYMEWSANYYNTYKDGDIAPGFNSAVRGYNYDMFDGVNYDIDISKPVGSRIVNLTYKKQPIDDNKIYKLAVNNYRYGTQLLSMKFVTPEDKFFDSVDTFDADNNTMRSLIAKYIKEKCKGKITPTVNNNWKIIGTNYNQPLRDEMIAKLKDFKLSVPTSFDGRTLNIKALNVYDYMKSGAVPSTKVVSLMSMNDFHGSLAEDAKNPGISKFSNYIKFEKAKNKGGSIVLSAGDMFQGSADSNLLYGQPVLTAMNAMGIDAMTLGNHEFDWGLDKLSAIKAGAAFPFLTANVIDKKTGKVPDFAKPYVIIEKNGIKVGIIGVTTPETTFTTKPTIIEGFEFKDPAETVNALVPEVKKAGADIVVVLGHIGAAQDAKTGVITGEAANLANKVTGVDAIMCGHSHSLISGKVNGIPVVQGWYNGRAVTHVDFYFDANTKAVTKVDPYVDNLSADIKNITEDANVKAWYGLIQAQLAPVKNVILGKAAVDLPHDTKTTQVTLLGEWASDVMRKAANVDIAFQNGGGLRRDIPKGDVTMGLMYELMPFDNTMYTMELTGKQVREAVETAIMPASVAPGQFAGITVKYDSKKPQGQRVVEIKMSNGTLLDDNKTYTIVTNDFQASGGDNYTVFKAGKNQKNTGIPVRETLVNAIKAQGTLNPVEDNRCIDINAAPKTGMLYFDLAA